MRKWVKQDIEGLVNHHVASFRRKEHVLALEYEEMVMKQCLHGRFGIAQISRRVNDTNCYSRGTVQIAALLTEALQKLFDRVYLASHFNRCVNAPDLPLEVQIVRLFSGIQLLFPSRTNEDKVNVRLLPDVAFHKKFTPEIWGPMAVVNCPIRRFSLSDSQCCCSWRSFQRKRCCTDAAAEDILVAFGANHPYLAWRCHFVRRLLRRLRD